MRGSARKLAVLVAGAAVLLAVGGRAAAEAPAGCAAEVQKFCPTIAPGGGHVLLCLQEHASQLSPECQQALQGAQRHAEKRRANRSAAGAWVSPCTGDIQKLCQGIPAGAGRIAECLGQHQAELSEGCRAAFGKAGK
jgi:hypothetical protein